MTVAALAHVSHASANPIELVEQIATAHDWVFERSADDEMMIEIAGSWSEYRMFFSWLDELSALHFACGFELTVPDHRRPAVNELLARINERLPVGHFDMWSDRGLPVFRHALLLRGAGPVSVEQVEDLVEIASTECERYYAAFQYVVWGGKTPAEAVDAALIETVGEA